MLPAWLTLYATPYLGTKRLQQLLQFFPSIEEIIAANDHAWREAGMPENVISHRERINQSIIEESLHFSQMEGNAILPIDHNDYPPLLRETYNPPMLLFVRGSVKILSDPQIAIVGARKPTQEGLYNSQLFAAELADLGLIITSGLALGVDQAAHRATIQKEKPTIAVLGTGLNNIYPKSHRGLSHEIIEKGGAIISEYPLNTAPVAQNFPRRNRIIAGLSLATLIIEATTQSGSLITARMSMEENRDVFAIPGSIHSPQSRGCHQLIREGAALVESTADIRQALSGWIDKPQGQQSLILDDIEEPPLSRHLTSRNRTVSTPNSQSSQKSIAPKTAPSASPNHSTQPISPKALPQVGADHPYKVIFDLLIQPQSINQLVETLKQPASEITTGLMMLEIEGLIQSAQGFYQQIR